MNATFRYHERGWEGTTPATLDGTSDLVTEPITSIRTCISTGVVAVCLLLLPATAQSGPIDVPLHLWTSAAYPEGLEFVDGNGASWGDYDSDGYQDLLVCRSGQLWNNLGGIEWSIPFDFVGAGLLPPASSVGRYGSSFGDYNNDGRPDLGTEPRAGLLGNSDPAFHLFRNDGVPYPTFTEVTQSILTPVQPNGLKSETLCWADVDGNGSLDGFLPVYPFGPDCNEPSSQLCGKGNYFFHNLGPPYSMIVVYNKLENPPNPLANAVFGRRPEGAQFCDTDNDGDLDLYSGSAVYQNRGIVGVPQFFILQPASSGVGHVTVQDEGALFLDYDKDSDYDLALSHCGPSDDGFQAPPTPTLWDNLGDGTFRLATVVFSGGAAPGGCVGISSADWDNDGDLDLTRVKQFWANTVDSGTAGFSAAAHSIQLEHLTQPNPSWADWDNDGDMDSAFANFQADGAFYQNDLYNSLTSPSIKRHICIIPVRNSVAVTNGIENEFGASSRVDILNVQAIGTQRNFTASSAGYLSQNQYSLHFALPADPQPSDPSEDVRFDLSIDFPSISSATEPQDNYWRVDKVVNPVLGNINLANLTTRKVRVFRGGAVALNGQLVQPLASRSPRLRTAGGGLMLSNGVDPLPSPIPALANEFIGIDFTTAASPTSLNVKELVIDGELASGFDCGGGVSNVTIWDISIPGSPAVLPYSTVRLVPSSSNDRMHYRNAVRLFNDKHYRLVAKGSRYRETDFSGVIQTGPVHVHGGLRFIDNAPCTGVNVEAAIVNVSKIPLSFRYAGDETGGMSSMGGGSGMGANSPVLSYAGSTEPGKELLLAITNAPPGRASALVFPSVPTCVRQLPTSGLV